MSEDEPISSELARLHYGSYTVLHPLGSGGMSSVYRAVHDETGHEVALKVLPVALAKNPVVLQRFLREARSAESLEHPNIVSIYDRGLDRGRHYLVLEYVQGHDLHDHVQLQGPLGLEEAVNTIRHAARGLSFAAGRGLVHRDIKPSNILRSDTGEIKIADLGLALQAGFEDERVTREGTTVGTVDYMAPEQARDSRAASQRSDLYSLGCTFYYLLAGIPPYPGGDITDKLTRHARSAPPDIHDLRPDVPEALSRVILTMMAKRPEDRFGSFDELLEALDRVRLPDAADGPGVALAPLDQRETRDDARGRIRAVAVGSAVRAPSSIPEISLANLPRDLMDASAAPGMGREAVASTVDPLPRRGGLPAWPDEAPTKSLSTWGWVSLCVAIGLAFSACVILIDRIVRSSPSIAVVEVPNSNPTSDPDSRPAELLATAEAAQPKLPQAPPVVVPATAPSSGGPGTSSPAHAAGLKADPGWMEPEDAEAPLAIATRYSNQELKTYLPEWALVPVPERIEGPLTVVRRVVAARDASVVSTLRLALDRTKGTTEIADEGPFLISEFVVRGESRLLRARPGHRPVIRLERPLTEAVRSLPGAIVLESKTLVLDSLDLVLNVRDLPPDQTSLFHCKDANLTVRNCTITVVNPTNTSFTLVRAQGSASRGTRVRFEKTLVRGGFTTGFVLGKGLVDVALRESVVVGCQGPIVREIERDRGSDHRFSLVGGVLAGRGPGFDLGTLPTGTATPKPLAIRAMDTVFGRFQGAGIASVIATANPAAQPMDLVSWQGDQNLFCGWKGFYASGEELTVRLAGLADFRSTWNGTDAASREILAPWPLPSQSDRLAPVNLAPFLPGHEHLLWQAAFPRANLEAKTLWTFPEPLLPVPAMLALDAGGAHSSMPGSGDPGVSDFSFDADDPRWHGDLGAFLRETIGSSVTHARVRVVGAGPRRCSPVRLPDGLRLEIRVEAPVNHDAEWLSWRSEPATQARALIELRGGSLGLYQVRAHLDPGATIESLIRVEDGDLVLQRCQLLSSPSSESETRLVWFTAATTKPRPPSGVSGLFAAEPDRPACIIADSTLIAGGAAIRVELGRGLVGLGQTAIAAATDAIELIPARVSRTRFEADLVLDQCTITSEANILRLGPWLGLGPGPDRPWLVTTRQCALMGSYDRRVSETVLLRTDQDAMAAGTLFWQGVGDALDVDAFTAAGEEPSTHAPRDVAFHWVNLWGANHMTQITGPRAGSNLPSVRLLERLKPGRVQPSDLCLDPSYHPGRPLLDAGADLARQGIGPRSPGVGRRR